MKPLKLSDRIYYEVTNGCNLNCIHCCNVSDEKRTFLDADEILKFHSKLYKLGIKDSVVTGGEPTLHKDFEKIIEGLCKVGKVVVTSNGIAWSSEKYIDFLKRNNNVFLQISLDGFSEKTYDNIRGIGNFRKAMHTIQDIVEEGYAKKIGLSMTIMNQNITDVKEVIEFARKNKIRTVHFPTLIATGNGNDNWNKIAPPLNKQIEIEEYFLGELLKDNKDTYISVNRINQLLAWIRSGYNYDYCCTPTLKVDPFGNILPCAIASGKVNSIGSIFNMNSIDDFMDILVQNWELALINHKSGIEQCKSCTEKDICPKHFCERCLFMKRSFKTVNEESIKYKCEIYKHHLKNIREGK
ncbi:MULTISPECIES: radical SAM protein [Clostridium]|uniref:Radical SAM protein n=1 Tax=Clostridium botulinum TaxID=1491 RepID=A0ABD7CF66_CLOBO|nr:MULTISPECIES: radical SAM protein [Clostridium]KGO15608.1 radical SAM protein [Clostridium botulinum]KOY66162.1 radical SAM protein [Clostridium sporogenes]MDS1006396.1 radical SAM protein [Clostridium sporogenes]QRI52008.1 radical SAM protein [Clostridium botulinum]